MTILPSQISSMIKLYTKYSDSSNHLFEKDNTEQKEPEDVVSISAEAKKRQIQELTKNEVLKRIKESLLNEKE